MQSTTQPCRSIFNYKQYGVKCTISNALLPNYLFSGIIIHDNPINTNLTN